MRAWVKSSHQKSKTIGFVPTMGALHEGHLSLVRLAKKEAGLVVVSIFVNPLQFGPQEDFERYPQRLEKDLVLLEKEKVDAVFSPHHIEMYPEGFQTKVELPSLSQFLCGKTRKGHFEGVATVVLKLFQIVTPDVAVFGNKDYQQRLIIETMVQDLNLNVRIVAAPIVREADGLAMSSRNSYLSLEERKRAVVLNQSLKRAEELFSQGERRSSRLIREVVEIIDKENPSHIDYVSICHVKTLAEISEVKDQALLAVAVFFGKTRLIDNVILEIKE